MTPARLSWRVNPAAFAEHLSGGAWVRAPHLHVVSRAIVAGVMGRGPRFILVTMPPRHGKSELISHWTPAWFLEAFPDRRVLLASYEATFAQSWGRKVRNTIREHKDELTVRVSRDSHAAKVWNTTRGGGMQTAGVRGPVTGKGGHLCIIDDPVKNWEDAQSDLKRKRTLEWWRSTFRTRMEPGGVVVLLMTRWHPEDLGGHAAIEAEANPSRWLHINLPAIAEDGDLLGRPKGAALWGARYDEQALEEIRQDITSYVFEALFQGHPAPPEGNLVKRAWLEKRLAKPPERVLDRVRGWDLAATEGGGDETAGVRLSLALDGRVVVEHALAGRWSVGTRDEILVATAEADSHVGARPTRHILEQEPGSSGKAEAARLAALLGRFPVKVEPSTGSKLTRALAFIAAAEAGRVVLVEGSWNQAFVDEWASWNGQDGERDNRVDGTTKGYNALPHPQARAGLGTDGLRVNETGGGRLT